MSVDLFKALADNSRLAIVNFLMKKDGYVEEISRGLNLAASTVSFHLKKLEEAGLVTKTKEQYYTLFSVNKEVFEQSLHELVTSDKKIPVFDYTAEEKFSRKVEHTFFTNGRLTKLPAQYKKRKIVLDKIASVFKTGEVLPEKDVDARIEIIYDDYCTIRRMLVDEGYFSRTNGIYTVEKSGTILKKENKERIKMISKEKRKEIILEYKEKAPEAGVYMIKNKVNGKRFIGTSVNLPGIMNRQNFLLNFGKHDNTKLQSDWNEFGKDAFEFTVLEQIKTEKGDNRKTLKEKLDKVEEKWHNLLIGDTELFYNTKIKKTKKE